MLSEENTRILAWAVLALLIAALAAWVAHIYRHHTFKRGKFLVYGFGWIMTRVVWRAQVEGRIPFARGQGAVIVCNHIGPIDPAFIQLACDRPVHWMVAREYVESWHFGGVLRTLEVIPVGRRGVDTAATRLAVRYAQQGDLVGLFPEGRINETRERLLLPGRPGAALIALKARVPVLPCYISDSPNDGTSWGFLFMMARTRIKIGQPIDLSPYYEREGGKEVLEELTLRFLSEIARLAGDENFQPELAGRKWKYGAEDAEAEVSQ
jgi:1-acyl-sn-glycerol-3-phosphate acyltransferase